MPIEPELPVVVDADTVDNINYSQQRGSLTDRTDKHDTTIPHTDLEDAPTLSEENGEVEEDNQQVNWGRYGRVVMWVGIALMWTVYEMDHTVLYNYQNYAASDFGQVSSLGALQTAGTIVIAVMKPPIAKISDVAGRAETYVCVVVLYIVSYILCATAPNFEQYAGGYVIYCIGATGMQILNQIIVADITTSRWRGLANGLINLPFMIIPWISAFIVQSALNTIGWRWGVGMFAIIMPVVSLSIIIPLFYFRRRSKNKGLFSRQSTTLKTFFVAIDVLGVTLLAAGCAMFLLPLSLAGNVSGGWSNPWIPIVTAIGLVLLGIFGFYEIKFADNPVMPACYFKNVSLVLACLIGLLDAFAFQATHTYMYAWSTVAHDFSARNATFLTYTSGCFQVLSGLITGYLMFKSRRYRWLLVIGVIIRLIGYAAMIRLRGATNPVWELFVVQAIQGLGSGTVGTIVLVVAQIVVCRAELAQATALVLLAIFMGQAIGSAVAGAIYTNLFKGRLRIHLGQSVSQATIDSVFDSITSNLPAVGTRERIAIDDGYSDILRYMTIAALVASAIPFVMVWFLPNLKLNDKHNLSDELKEKDTSAAETSDDAASPTSSTESIHSPSPLSSTTKPDGPISPPSWFSNLDPHKLRKTTSSRWNAIKTSFWKRGRSVSSRPASTKHNSNDTADDGKIIRQHSDVATVVEGEHTTGAKPNGVARVSREVKGEKPVGMS